MLVQKILHPLEQNWIEGRVRVPIHSLGNSISVPRPDASGDIVISLAGSPFRVGTTSYEVTWIDSRWIMVAGRDAPGITIGMRCELYDLEIGQWAHSDSTTANLGPFRKCPLWSVASSAPILWGPSYDGESIVSWLPDRDVCEPIVPARSPENGEHPLAGFLARNSFDRRSLVVSTRPGSVLVGYSQLEIDGVVPENVRSDVLLALLWLTGGHDGGDLLWDVFSLWHLALLPGLSITADPGLQSRRIPIAAYLEAIRMVDPIDSRLKLRA